MNRKLSVVWNGRDTDLKFVPVVKSSNSEENWIADLEVNEHHYFVAIHKMPDIAWIFPDLTGVAIAELPEELAKELLSVCFEHSLDQIADDQLKVKIHSLEHKLPSLENTSLETGWQISCGSRAKWLTGTLSGEPAAMSFLADLTSKAPTCPVRSIENIPLLVSVSIGEIMLPSNELKNLAENDVILGDFDGFTETGKCDLFLGSRKIATGNLNGDRISLLATTEEPGLNQSDSSDPQARHLPENEGSESDTGNINIPLRFVIGSCFLTSADLSSLSPGMDVTAASISREYVSLLTDGKKVASGKLVKIGTSNGIQISQIKHS